MEASDGETTPPESQTRKMTNGKNICITKHINKAMEYKPTV